MSAAFFRNRLVQGAAAFSDRQRSSSPAAPGITRVYVPPVSLKLLSGELKNILLAGVEGHPALRLCDHESAADFVLLDSRHLIHGAYEIVSPAKTIIIDYRDQPVALFPHDVLLYFKRSIVDRSAGQVFRYDRPVRPISYCVRNEYVNMSSLFPAQRDFDVAVFFDPAEHPDTARNRYRALVTQTVLETFGHLKLFAGIAGQRGVQGRNSFQPEYFTTMARSKIIVTCNPDRWEGDYRLFEALSSGALVLSDTMSIPMPHPLEHRLHLIYYDRDEPRSLVREIERHLADARAREAIAQAGYTHAMRYHKAADRIGEVVRLAKVISDVR